MDCDIQRLGRILVPHIVECLSPTRAELLWGTEVGLVEARIERTEARIGILLNIELLAKLDIGWAQWTNIDLVEAHTELHRASGYTEVAIGS